MIRKKTVPTAHAPGRVPAVLMSLLGQCSLVAGAEPPPPPQYAELNRYFTDAPILPSLYLHGRDDGCMTAAFTQWAEKVLPAGSEAAIVDHAGHFLQLEQPDKVAELVLGFIGSPGSSG